MSGNNDEAQASAEEQSSPWRSLVGIGLLVVLIGGIWLVMHELSAANKMQDCLASGRTNCAQLDLNATGGGSTKP